MSWPGDITDFLVGQKRAGVPFAEAWSAAVFAHPPRLRDLGVNVAWTDSLFEQSGAEAVAWFCGVVEAAYEDWPAACGGPSRLRGLRAALEGGWHDDTVIPLAARGAATHAAMGTAA